jgi:hypothetical protein
MTFGRGGRRALQCLRYDEYRFSIARVTSTWVDRGVDGLLRRPQLRAHLPYLACLVRCDELFGMLETGRGGEKCPIPTTVLVLHSHHKPRRGAILKAKGGGTHHTQPLFVQVNHFRHCSHLGSEISAECLTRPQYVLRSY